MEYKEVSGEDCSSHDENGCSDDDKECKGIVLESHALNECDSTCQKEYLQYKVPVVIAEFTVEVATESRIKLEEQAIEIKRIKKNVFLTQCRLIGGTKKVFIRGFIRKNIEYAAVNSYNNSAICGDIKHTTVHVPFHCVAELKNMRKPQIRYSPASREINYLSDKNMGRSMKEVDMHSEEIFNERVYCELVYASIHEANIVEELEEIGCLPAEHIFQSFLEKEVICLTIKLLQKQQIYMKDKEDCSSYEKETTRCSEYDWQEQENY